MSTNRTAIVVAAIAIAVALAWRVVTQEPEEPARQAETVDQADPVTSPVPQPVPERRDVAEPQTEVVMGLEVRKDRNCKVERIYIENADGSITEAVHCVSEPAPNPYAHYTHAELMVLAYDTAGAAIELGKRLHASDPEAARAYMLRALALDPSNISPVAWLAATSYSLRGNTPEARQAIANQYVVTKIMEHFNPEQSAAWIVGDALDAGMTHDDIRLLDDRARGDLMDIRDIQLEVFGSATVEVDE